MSRAGYQTLTISSRYDGAAVHGLGRLRSIRCSDAVPTWFGGWGRGQDDLPALRYQGRPVFASGLTVDALTHPSNPAPGVGEDDDPLLAPPSTPNGGIVTAEREADVVEPDESSPPRSALG